MSDKKKSIRRIGANIIETFGGTIEQGIVIIEDGIVLKVYPLFYCSSKSFNDIGSDSSYRLLFVAHNLSDLLGMPRSFIASAGVLVGSEAG